MSTGTTSQVKHDFFRNFLILATSNTDSSATSVAAFDLYGNALHSDNNVGATFKSCIADRHCLCALSSSTSSSSGSSFSNRQDGDFLIVAQPNKPQINIYEWGRSQVHLQCHTQEVVTAVASDLLGHFLFAGSRKGFLYIWNILDGQLICASQIHFQQITKLCVTKDSQFLISAGEDGSVKVWLLYRLLDFQQAQSSRVVSPHSAWSEHTSSVRDFVVFESGPLRVLSCSTDRHIVLYDVNKASVVSKISLFHPLECIASNFSVDFIVSGTSNGLLSFCNFSFLSSQSHREHTESVQLERRSTEGSSAVHHGVINISAHSRKINGLLVLPDNATLVSSSEDGKLKFWNLYLQQLLREVDCFQGLPVTNCQLFARPQHLLSSSLSKQGIFPIVPLRKYADGDAKDGRVAVGPVNLSLHHSLAGEVSYKYQSVLANNSSQDSGSGFQSQSQFVSFED